MTSETKTSLDWRFLLLLAAIVAAVALSFLAPVLIDGGVRDSLYRQSAADRRRRPSVTG